jgi:hypothetical protein
MSLVRAPIIVLYSIYIALDIISLMCALILNAINQKLHVINARTDLRLSSRYQVSENIRVLEFLRKLLILGVIIALLCTASSLSIRSMALKNYQLLARISYFGVYSSFRRDDKRLLLAMEHLCHVFNPTAHKRHSIKQHSLLL